ncbi:hypothetical protein, partial [Tenacibaculum maritimum]
IFSSCAIKKTSKVVKEDFSIEINKKKGIFKSKKYIHLYVNIFNNTNEDIVILKPKTEWKSMLHFFSSSIKCQNPSDLFGTTLEQHEKKIERSDDLVTIKAKSNEEFKISGFIYDLVCDSKKVLIKIRYNSIKIPSWVDYSFFGEDKLRIKELFQKLTKIDIESKETLINLY